MKSLVMGMRKVVIGRDRKGKLGTIIGKVIETQQQKEGESRSSAITREALALLDVISNF